MFDTSGYEGFSQAYRQGRVKDWLYDFLRHDGTPNGLLAYDLDRVPDRIYLIVEVPLELPRRINGPEPDLPYHEDLPRWEAGVGSITERIEAGWRPQPLLISGRSDEEWSVRDGSHRLEGLRRTGAQRYAAIIFFDNKLEEQSFMRRYGRRLTII